VVVDGDATVAVRVVDGAGAAGLAGTVGAVTSAVTVVVELASLATTSGSSRAPSAPGSSLVLEESPAPEEPLPPPAAPADPGGVRPSLRTPGRFGRFWPANVIVHLTPATQSLATGRPAVSWQPSVRRPTLTFPSVASPRLSSTDALPPRAFLTVTSQVAPTGTLSNLRNWPSRNNTSDTGPWRSQATANSKSTSSEPGSPKTAVERRRSATYAFVTVMVPPSPPAVSDTAGPPSAAAAA
jgi:hypothetical protein